MLDEGSLFSCNLLQRTVKRNKLCGVCQPNLFPATEELFLTTRYFSSAVLNEARGAASFFSGNTILQANRYNWQFLNVLSKSSFSFQVIFLNPVSHITFSALCWYPSSVIKCFLCCPLASLYVFNLNPFLINPGSKYLSCVCCSSLHLSSCQYLSANETSASRVTGDLCLLD